MPYIIFKNKQKEFVEMWDAVDMAEHRKSTLQAENPRSTYVVEQAPLYRMDSPRDKELREKPVFGEYLKMSELTVIKASYLSDDNWSFGLSNGDFCRVKQGKIIEYHEVDKRNS